MKKGTRVRPFLEPREPGRDDRGGPSDLPHAVDVDEIGRVPQVIQLDAHPFDLQEIPYRSSHQFEDQENREDPVRDGADTLPAASCDINGQLAAAQVLERFARLS